MRRNVIDIPKKYLKFFIKNYQTRYLLIQGSRRSGKSFSTYKWLRFLSTTGQEQILICTATYGALQLAIQDFEKATMLTVEGSAKLGYNAKTPEGSIFQFRSFDEDPTKAQGTSCTYVFFEEALNIDIRVIKTLLMSCTKQAYFCYNPTKKSQIDSYIKKDSSNYLHTTYLDNSHLTKEQREEFEVMKEAAEKPGASLFDIYAWKVYGLGEFQGIGGKVFKSIYTCTDEEYSNIRAYESFGLDFGFVDGNDETILVGVKVLNNILYVKQYISSNKLGDNKTLALELSRLGFSCYDTIVADYGGLGKERIKKLASADFGEWVEEGINKGFNIINAKKGRIIDGVQKLLQYEKIVVTEDSTTLREELDRYELDDTGKESSKHQNGIDALRYANNSYQTLARGYK